MDKQAIKGKRRARILVVQAIYQWLMTASDLYEIEAQFRVVNNMDVVDTDYFCRLLYGIPKQQQTLEQALLPFLDRDVRQLNPVEHAVLLLGCYELQNCPEIPYKVVLDESVNLAKRFGAQEGHRYVNGVLNNLARKTRITEIGLENG